MKKKNETDREINFFSHEKDIINNGVRIRIKNGKFYIHIYACNTLLRPI